MSASRSRGARIGGSDPFAGPDSFAARGYTVGDLWDQPADFVGVAAALLKRAGWAAGERAG